MLKLDENDFFPLENFEYLSRWTECEDGVLPSAILSQIRTIKPETSTQIWDALYPVCGNDFYNFIFSSLRNKVDLNRFLSINHFSIEKQPIRNVSHWLSSLEIPVTTHMVFCWDPKVAVKTTWEIFVSYWDDFCYFGEDDVFISAIEGPWRLLFFHEGDIVYGLLNENFGLIR